ncbi:MAG: amino acid ABC transporter substrate-binding protein [Longicatena sp.]
MKKLVTCLVAFVCVLGISGCSKKGNAETDKKTLTIGIDNTFAPMGFKNDKGEIVGFDVEVAKEVAKKINKEVKFQNIDWDLKETELETGNIDLIWNGYSVTDERKEKVLFSDPYLKNRQIMITTDKTNIKSKADSKDKTLSVQKNSSAYEAVMKDTAFVKTLKGGAPVQYETNNDCFMDLEAGRSDVIVVDETLARYYMKQQTKGVNYVVLEDNFGTEDYAIGMRKSDKKLCESINKALKELQKEGTFDKIKNTWFE